MQVSFKVSWDASRFYNISFTFETGKRVYRFENALPSVSSADVQLWWPNGMGDQPLYDIFYCLGSHCSQKTVGFRSIALVTGNETDPEYVDISRHQEGTDSHGMYMKVNGKVVYARGANMIPMDEMEGRLSDESHEKLVENARLANMNMLRVWGGGMFLPASFYQACDRLGITLYHDMMYAQLGHNPSNCSVQSDEVEYQVLRLAHYASIVIWDACNECGVAKGDLYTDFILKAVVQHDISRIVWPASPSNGWESGVHKLTCIPIARNVSLIPKANGGIEGHGPYVHGTGFPAVNGLDGPSEKRYYPKFPVELSLSNTGPEFRNSFQSEFGAVTTSSFESMSAMLLERHYSMHGGEKPDICAVKGMTITNECNGTNAMAERNYPCDSIIHGTFGANINLSLVGEKVFRSQLYLCMLASALAMKAEITVQRSENHFGALVWQLNEIWPTGGWGSLEYGPFNFDGQVAGGRWKILHHFYRDFLFSSIFAACGAGMKCFIKNDDIQNQLVNFQIHSCNSINGVTKRIFHQDNIYIKRFKIWTAPVLNTTSKLLLLSVSDSEGNLLVHSFSLQAKKVVVTEPRTCEVSHKIIIGAELATIQLRSACDVLLFVQLTTLAQGRFSDNGFVFIKGIGPSRCVGSKPLQCPPIVFIPHDKNQMLVLKQTLKIEHLQQAVSNLLHSPVISKT